MSRIAASGAVLVGGRSRRFHSDKAFMPFGGTSVAQLLFERLSSVLAEVFFVADQVNKLAGHEHVTVADLQPGLGPLAGLQATLHHAANDYSFVTACDLPFLDERLLPILWQNTGEADVIVPVWNDRVEPLAGFYHRRCYAQVEAALEAGRRSMRDFWPLVNVVRVDVTRHFDPESIERMFFNVNTPGEYRKMLTMVDGK
ncbi:molybdenum cofactor guanylyltransferase [bacterium]|nr:molybdenum cofactor guanylyltransferase [bacterium]MBU1983341.1 molybdenum cofactor guanylyltransferase [bacterium]